MAADIINLRQRRKEKARGEKDKTSAENRERFGQTKTQERLSKSQKDKIRKNLDGAKRGKHDEDLSS